MNIGFVGEKDCAISESKQQQVKMNGQNGENIPVFSLKEFLAKNTTAFEHTHCMRK